MKKILIPIDFSDVTEHAIMYTLDWVKKWEAQVTLIHVVYFPIPEHEIPNYGMYTPAASTQAVQDEIEQGARDNMQSLVNKLRKYVATASIHATIAGEVRIGDPITEIDEKVTSDPPDLLVIGIKQRNFLDRILWGSSAPQLINQIQIPILAIPEDTTYKGVRRILFASDFDESDPAIFLQMHRFFQEEDPNIFCVHVADNQQNVILNQKTAYMENMLREHLKNIKANVQYDVMVAKDLTQALEEYTQTHQIDWVVVGTHKRKWLEKIFHPSQTQKLLLQLPKPLMIFHV